MAVLLAACSGSTALSPDGSLDAGPADSPPLDLATPPDSAISPDELVFPDVNLAMCRDAAPATFAAAAAALPVKPRLLWSTVLESSVYGHPGSPVLGRDDTIWIVGNRSLHRVSPAGKLLWLWPSRRRCCSRATRCSTAWCCSRDRSAHRRCAIASGKGPACCRLLD